ncbi:MAG: hypothetical protein WC225_01815 [Acholeplasmataceae bacterium]
MSKYSELLNLIQENKWTDEDDFLIDALSVGSIKLIQKCHLELKNKSIIPIPPLLRQIQENIIVLLGLISKTYTVEEFIKKGNQPKKIMNNIKSSSELINIEEFQKVSDFLLGVKEVLNKFSHSNFEGTMILFTDNYQVDETRQFNHSMMLILIKLIEASLIAILNINYKALIEMPNPNIVINELKKIKSLKYATRKLPRDIQDFINNSTYIKGYYNNVFNNLQKFLKDIKF